MNLINSVKNLLFNPTEFFKTAPKGFFVPILVTLIYAAVSVIVSLPTYLSIAGTHPNLAAVIAGTSIVSAVIVIFVTWILLSLFFFGCLKIIGYAKCSYKEVLKVVSYGAVPLTIQVIVTWLIGFIGTPEPVLTIILSGAFLIWTIPIWIAGFESITDIPRQKIITCVMIPVIVMVIVTITSFVLMPPVDTAAGAAGGEEVRPFREMVHNW